MLFRCKVEYLPGFVQSAAKYRAFFPLIVSCFLSFYAGGYPVKILIIIFPLHTGQASNVADVMPVGVTLPAPSQIGQRCQALLARSTRGNMVDASTKISGSATCKTLSSMLKHNFKNRKNKYNQPRKAKQFQRIVYQFCRPPDGFFHRLLNWAQTRVALFVANPLVKHSALAVLCVVIAFALHFRGVVCENPGLPPLFSS